MRTPTKSLSVALWALAVVALTACGSTKHASPEVTAACNDLKSGNWSNLLNSSDNSELFDDSLGDGFGVYISKVAMYGNWYSVGAGYNQGFPSTWTVSDAKAAALKELKSVWNTCAKHVDGFPSSVDTAVADQIQSGAAKQFDAAPEPNY